MLKYDYFQVDSGCVTTSGPQQNAPCVFPFTKDGVWFPACVNYDNGHLNNMDEYWCPTKINDDGSFIKDQWGLCSEHCPKVIYGKILLPIYVE